LPSVDGRLAGVSVEVGVVGPGTWRRYQRGPRGVKRGMGEFQNCVNANVNLNVNAVHVHVHVRVHD
ncbi:MAG: hypothetical protein ACJ79C_07000, partial [Myxococcales bacterium]